MDQMTQILQQAQRRAEEQGLPYRGALTPQEAHQLKQALPEATLLDVRSAAEWQFVGVVPYAQRLEWRSFPECSLIRVSSSNCRRCCPRTGY